MFPRYTYGVCHMTVYTTESPLERLARLEVLAGEHQFGHKFPAL